MIMTSLIIQEAEFQIVIQMYNIEFVNRRKLLLESVGKTYREEETDEVGKWQEIQLEL